MAKSKEIKLVPGSKETELSPDQKKFNRLVKQIAEIKERMENLKEYHAESQRLYTELIYPLEIQLNEERKNFVFELDKNPYNIKLSPRQQENLEIIICYELNTLANSQVEGLEELLDKYFPEEELSEEEKLAEEKDKKYFAEMFTQATGIDLDLENIDSIEDINRHILEKMDEIERKREEKRAKRKKSKAEIEKEKRIKEEEEKLNRSTKEIYMELVKNFHPDQEQDPALRDWKTQVMQELTVAYNDNNLMKLLELQVSLLEGKDKELQKLSDDKLKLYNKILQSQKNELETDLMVLNGNGMMGVRFLGKLNSDFLLKQMSMQAERFKHSISHYSAMRGQVMQLRGLKEMIKMRIGELKTYY